MAKIVELKFYFLPSAAHSSDSADFDFFFHKWADGIGFANNENNEEVFNMDNVSLLFNFWKKLNWDSIDNIRLARFLCLG